MPTLEPCTPNRGGRGAVAASAMAKDLAAARWPGLCSVSPLHGLSDPLIGISRLAGELETRVELAIAYNTGDDGARSKDSVLYYTLPGSAESIEAVKSQLGIEIAQGIQALIPQRKSLCGDDVVRLEHYTDLLTKYAGDESVMDGLFAKLGPRGAVEVPIMLKDFADLTLASDRALAGQGNKQMLPQVADLQQQFMESFGTGLATATKSVAFNKSNPDFGTELAQAAAATHTGTGWALAQILRHGTYAAGFLGQVGVGLTEAEMNGPGSWWDGDGNGDVAGWHLGTDTASGYSGYQDPFKGLLEAMSRTQGADLAFFSPQDPDNKASAAAAAARMDYLLGQRSWFGDDMKGLGASLDRAATEFHTSGSTQDQQQRSAWVASAMVHGFGQDGAQRIGDGANDSLAHLLSVYISDVNWAANSDKDIEYPTDTGPIGFYESAPGATPQAPGMFAPWRIGLPWGAKFPRHSLNTVLSQVLLDKAAMTTVSNAAGTWSANAINQGAEAWDHNPDWKSHYQGAAKQSAQLTGYLLGNVEVGGEAAGRSEDERAALVVDFVGAALKAVPMGGQVVTQVGRQAIAQAGHETGAAWFHNEASADDRAEQIQTQSLFQLKVAAGHSLMGRKNLSKLVKIDPDVVNGLGGDVYLANWLDEGSGGEVGLGLSDGIGIAFGKGKKYSGAGK